MDAASIEELYRRYGAMVRRRARALLGDDQAAKDAVQEVFVRALRSGSEFRQEASPVTWLYRVTTNHCFNVMRQGSRHEVLLAHQARDEAVAPSHDDRLTLVALLRRVPEPLQEIAVYYYLDDMNQDEIASLVGVSRRTVGNRLEEFRALAREAGLDPEPAPEGKP